MGILLNLRKKIAVCLVSGVALVAATSAQAAEKYAALIIDADTGVVLHQENAGEYRYPASLVKMMTIYMVFQAIENGKLSMDQKIRVSAKAEMQAPSKLGLRMGDYITVSDAVNGVIIKSANDAAVVLAEAVGGNEWQFVSMMNRMARRLGMNHTHFQNSSGLPDRRQKTTAYDLARVAIALRRDHPQYYYLFAKPSFAFQGHVVNSHNRVTKGYKGADGLKTGYIRDSGFNLVTSATRSGRRLIGVVMGGNTAASRDKKMISLLDQAFYKVANSTRSGKSSVSSKSSVGSQQKVKDDIEDDVSSPDDSSTSDQSSVQWDKAPVPVLKANSPQQEGNYQTPS